jgi:ubiquinone/menaquinone biosynthesis C-methylase UbiE
MNGNKIKQTYLFGNVFKGIRKEVFNFTLHQISNHLHMSSTSYNRFENNQFGKSFFQKNESNNKFWSKEISELAYTENKVEKLKDYLLKIYSNSSIMESEYLYKLQSYKIHKIDDLESFVYCLLSLFSGTNGFKLDSSGDLDNHINTQNSFRLNNNLNGLIYNYKEMKNVLHKTVRILKPKNILELGFASGDNSIIMQKASPNSKITAIDERDEMKRIAIKNMNNQGMNGISFKTTDLSYVDQLASMPDFTLMMYTFHHIEDPLEQKYQFLKTIFLKMYKGQHLCICDIFLPESISEPIEYIETRNFWNNRIKETYYNSFWNSLQSFSSEDIEISKKIAKRAFDNEILASNLVLQRENEYLVKLSWLKETTSKIGFKIVVCEYINALNDGVVLLQK